MLSVQNWGNKSTLAQGIVAASDKLVLPNGAARLFRLSNQTHYYLTLRNSGRREVVRVVGAFGNELMVERGQDGTLPQVFPPGTCIEVEWNPQQLREFIFLVQSTTEPTGVNPGTYCMDCTTCLTVNAAGQIVNINGAEGC